MSVVEILRIIDGNCDQHCAIGASMTAEEELTKICKEIEKKAEEIEKMACPGKMCLMDDATHIAFTASNYLRELKKRLCG